MHCLPPTWAPAAHLGLTPNGLSGRLHSRHFVRYDLRRKGVNPRFAPLGSNLIIHKPRFPAPIVGADQRAAETVNQFRLRILVSQRLDHPRFKDPLSKRQTKSPRISVLLGFLKIGSGHVFGHNGLVYEPFSSILDYRLLLV